MSVSAIQAAATRGVFLPTLAALGAGLAALVAVFWPEGRAAVGVWYESTAYGHCFLVLPIAAYLAWERRDSLRGLLPKPNPALAVLGLPLPFAWLAAERLGIMEGRQLVAIAWVELLFLVVLGWRLFRALSGPLLYLIFLVPFGAFITPQLQAFTAGFIDAGLNLLGIPHFITDMTIEISAGTFYVAEACAGLRFLIASIAFGVFFALLNYNSPGRRVAFIAASIIVPIVANGFRALGIVVLGNILGSAQAAAADHIIYGWVFFSFVTLLLVLAGLPFREPLKPAPLHADHPSSLRALPVAAALVFLLASIGPAAAFALNSRATPAHFAARPALAEPPGCQIHPTPNDMPDRAAYTMACGDRVWTIVLQAISDRYTGAASSEARNVLSGPVDAEEATTGSLPGASNWQTTAALDPGFVIASAAWVDGRPATGGLQQRLLQARNSILGGQSASVAAVASYRPGHTVTERQIDAAKGDLTRFVAAQPDLDATLTEALAPRE